MKLDEQPKVSDSRLMDTMVKYLDMLIVDTKEIDGEYKLF